MLLTPAYPKLLAPAQVVQTRHSVLPDIGTDKSDLVFDLNLQPESREVMRLISGAPHTLAMLFPEIGLDQLRCLSGARLVFAGGSFRRGWTWPIAR